MFWLNGPNDDDPTVLAMVEYDGENNTIRLLTGDMDNPDVAMSTELIQNQLFEEQIEYNGDTGVFSYSLNGEQTQTQIVQKQEGYLMVVMQTVSGEAGGTFYLDELEAQSKGNN